MRMYSYHLRESLQPLLAQYNVLAEMNIPEKADVFVDHLTPQELLDLKSAHRHWSLHYIVDTIPMTLRAFSEAHQIPLILPMKLESYLLEMQTTQVHPVAVFWGVQPQLGTSLTAVAFAEALAKKYTVSVGVLNLNMYSDGTWLFPETRHQLHELQSYFQLRGLTPDRLKDSMEVSRGIHFLPGNHNPLLGLHYTPEHMEYLIDVAKHTFEVVVLDAGSILNTAPAICSLRAATHRYLVSGDLLTMQSQYQHQLEYILKPLGLQEILLIGNRMRNPTNLPAFAKGMDVLPLVAIKEFPDISYYTEDRTDPLSMYWEEKQFSRAIDTLVSGFAKSFVGTVAV